MGCVTLAHCTKLHNSARSALFFVQDCTVQSRIVLYKNPTIVQSRTVLYKKTANRADLYSLVQSRTKKRQFVHRSAESCCLVQKSDNSFSFVQFCTMYKRHTPRVACIPALFSPFYRVFYVNRMQRRAKNAIFVHRSAKKR